MYMVIYAGDAQKLDELEQSFDLGSERFLASTASYRETITSPDSLALLDETISLFNNAFKPAVEKCLEVANAGDGTAA